MDIKKLESRPTDLGNREHILTLPEPALTSEKHRRPGFRPDYCSGNPPPAVVAKSSRRDQGNMTWISSGIMRDNLV
ncbi:MAG: hypothetical protein WBV18_13840, partial [Methyloceanibacter sp.]|uniref:hypothetical protein n=1 Tax=Methyloceanibacter sp. TaxID=1965321 RepID=UPI003C61013D